MIFFSKSYYPVTSVYKNTKVKQRLDNTNDDVYLQHNNVISDDTISAITDDVFSKSILPTTAKENGEEDESLFGNRKIPLVSGSIVTGITTKYPSASSSNIFRNDQNDDDDDNDNDDITEF
jgi:hypothetical protein